MNNQQNNQNETETSTIQTLSTDDILQHEKKFWETIANAFTAYVDLIQISKQFKQKNNAEI